MNTNKIYDIKERVLEFAASVARLVNKFPKNQAAQEYSKQLIRSSASIGANIEEADGTLTKKDFINKMGIGRREARESKYWLRLIQKAELINNPSNKDELNSLAKEAEELTLILSSIINKTKAKKNV